MNMQEWEKQYDILFNNITPENTRDTKIKSFIQAQIDKAREELAREIISSVDNAEVYLKSSANIFSDEVIDVCINFKKDIVEQLKAKYIKE